MLSESVKFTEVCLLLSKLRDAKGANASAIRKKNFEKFMECCREKCADDEDFGVAIHPILRLILSSLDTRTLSIKEKKLADRVCKALALSAADLPTANISSASKVCEILSAEVSSRIAPDDFEHLSVAEINEKLDSMSENPGSDELQYLFKNCSQEELFWLFSTMIKNVESTIGVATSVILSWMGPEARNRWNIARDLGEIRENAGEEFFVETKYDGEHVLLHKISRDQYKWYTRNGKDFTKDYGGSSTLTDLVSGRIHPLFRSSVNDCILDCELMLWDKKLRKLEEVETLFTQALAAGEEGIVVKNKDVTYQSGTRMTKNGWFKLKAYLGDNELDVAVVAIMPEKGKDGQTAYQLAVRDGDIYRTITTCSSGLSRVDRDYIYHLATRAEGPLLKEAPPELRGWNISDAKGGFIRREHWLVVEMTAAGVRDGKFIDPVMRRIRHDKDVEEVDTIATFRDYEEKLGSSKLSDKSAVPEIDAKCVRTDSPLAGCKVCVLFGTDERLRKRLMELLKQYGANVVANPVDDMSLVVATTDKHLKTRTQIEAVRYPLILITAKQFGFTLSRRTSYIAPQE
ncbi:unnamed protein product [Nippostrongylus brasiliensis]|uniref:DNA ligase 4 (inferred by orthology to a human protein) n=1 Tax=Nippostrongylus brasiliensis TaxID=27835 RepID=A0A158QXM2_NIPBR|nr:unnamed protein product [Nippostrongylus brasiliensis]